MSSGRHGSSNGTESTGTSVFSEPFDSSNTLTTVELTAVVVVGRVHRDFTAPMFRYLTYLQSNE